MVCYAYDTWGKLLSITGPRAANLGLLNPFRYRSYVYDDETGLYYLGSRYYNPTWGRFINADTTEVLTATLGSATFDKNLFAYCDNNPVNRKDDGGEFWHLVVGAAVGLAAQYVSDVATNLLGGASLSEALKPTSTLADYGAAALSGALAASGIGLGASVAANAAIGAIAYIADCDIKHEDLNITDLALATGIGAFAGRIGGKGANGAKLRGVADTSKDILKHAVSPKKSPCILQKSAFAVKLLSRAGRAQQLRILPLTV